MNLETSKNLGGVGALLIFLGPLLGVVPGVGAFAGLLSLIGMIMVIVGLKGFADYYKEAGIINNALYAIITAIAGGVALVAVMIFALVDLFAELNLNIANIQEWSRLGELVSEIGNLGVLFNFVGMILVAVLVMFLVLVITAFFLRRSLGILSAKTGVGLFGTAGLLLFIGAILTIIVFGVLLFWIGILLLAIAFFQVRAQPPAS